MDSETIQEMVREAKRRGLMGIAVIDQGGKRGLVAGCINRDASFCDPRNWDTHPSVEAALCDLAERMGVKIARPEPEVAELPNCETCGCVVDPFTGQVTVEGQLCETCARKARMRDPNYTPTIAEAVADPAGFVEGMTETRREVRQHELGGEG